MMKPLDGITHGQRVPTGVTTSEKTGLHRPGVMLAGSLYFVGSETDDYDEAMARAAEGRLILFTLSRPESWSVVGDRELASTLTGEQRFDVLLWILARDYRYRYLQIKQGA